MFVVAAEARELLGELVRNAALLEEVEEQVVQGLP